MVKANKTWTVPAKNLVAGQTIKAIQTDKAGNASTETSIVITDGTPPNAPIINPVSDVDTQITGTGEVEATLTVTFEDNSTKTAVVQNDGTWTVPANNLVAGQTIKATQTDAAGNVSETASIAVTDGTPPSAPVVNPVNGRYAIKGTAEPESTVTVTFPDGSTLTTITDADGKWVVRNPGLEDGDILKVKATDAAGNESEEVTVIVDGKSPEAPIIDQITDSDTKISGKGEVGAIVVVILPYNNKHRTTVDDNGIWTLSISEPLAAGKKVLAKLIDVAGNNSNITQTTVIAQFSYCTELWEKLDFPQLLSLNNDATNDSWNLLDLQEYCTECTKKMKKNKVIIYDRYGSIVFEQKNYMFDGQTFTGKETDGETLPAGTYFYVVEVEGQTPKTGFIHIIKQ